MQKGRNDLQKSGIFNSDNLNIIKREGKPNIFSNHLNQNLVRYLYDFFYYRELSDICCTNIYLYNCFREYEMSNWKMEMQNIINIFNLDIKDPKNEIDDTLNTCIKKKRISYSTNMVLIRLLHTKKALQHSLFLIYQKEPIKLHGIIVLMSDLVE